VPPVPCPCGVKIEQPWSDANTLCSKGSVVLGVLLLAFGVLLLFLGTPDVISLVLVGMFAVSLLASFVFQGVRGHRASCLVRRGVWYGIGSPAAVVRTIGNSP
jgi:hypothetical protein